MDQTLEDMFAEIRDMKAENFPVHEVSTVSEDISCIDLINSFLEQSSPITIVTDEKDKYIGILTIKDILPLLQKRKTDLHDALLRSRVLTCMTAFDLAKRQLPTVSDDDSVLVIASIMDSYDVVFLPRVKERKGPILGVISLMDILAQVKESWDCACDAKEDD